MTTKEMYLPQGLTVSQVAAVLRLSPATVKTALNTGALESWQLGARRGWRYCTPAAVTQFASERGLVVDWDALPDSAI